MGQQTTADEKRMKLRYAGACRICGADLPTGTEAVYERTAKTVRCLMHVPEEKAPSRPEPAPGPAPESTTVAVSGPAGESADELAVLDPGTPGGSARREFERRQRARRGRVRAKH